MDEVTRNLLLRAAKLNPGCAISLDRMFLDGTKPHECGFVPNDWNGKTVSISWIPRAEA